MNVNKRDIIGIRKCQVAGPGTITISIPVQICNELNIGRGTRLKYSYEENKIIYEKLDINVNECDNTYIRECQKIGKQNSNCGIVVSIPKEICNDLNILKGTKLICSYKENKIIYEKLDSNNHENTYSTVEEHESNTA